MKTLKRIIKDIKRCEQHAKIRLEEINDEIMEITSKAELEDQLIEKLFALLDEKFNIKESSKKRALGIEELERRIKKC